jgi:acetyl-CoA carboxylase carboxyltransferase component
MRSRAIHARSTRCAPIVEALVDEGTFLECGRRWGRPVITGLARLDGWPVAVMASDPYHYGGAWTADACDKVIRFVDLAQTFHLPVVHLVDVPGFLIGREAEVAGTIRHGTRAMQAVYQSTVPWCVIIVRKVYGVAGAAHMNPARYCMRYAWPSGDWGSLPIAGGLEAAYKAEIEAASDPAAKLRRDRSAPQQAPLAVPQRRELQHRRDHRPARHAPDPHRVRRACGAVRSAGRAELRLPGRRTMAVGQRKRHQIEYESFGAESAPAIRC